MAKSDVALYVGLRELLKGEDTIEADAAGLFVAETFLMWRSWLNSKFRK